MAGVSMVKGVSMRKTQQFAVSLNYGPIGLVGVHDAPLVTARVGQLPRHPNRSWVGKHRKHN